MSWRNRDAEESFNEVWDRLRKAVVGICTGHLSQSVQDKKVLDGVTLRPDLSEPELWRIETAATKVYDKTGENTLRETATSILGVMEIVRYGNSVGRTEFKLETPLATPPTFTLKMNCQQIIGLIESAIQESENKSTARAMASTMSHRMEIFNLEREKAMKSSFSDVKSALKSLGFSEEERNTMVLAAMNHESFHEGMSSEEMIALALRTK